MRKFLLGLTTLFVLAPSTHATGIEEGTVRFMHNQIFSNGSHPGYTFFYLEGGTPRSEKPACATYDSGERWVINNSWPAAKLQIAVLLSAALAGRRVRVQGTGDCAAWGDSETVWDILLVE
jgi:hypothetical protein